MRGTEIIARALKHLGKLYRWGATGPDVFDCFGLVEGLAREFGHPFPREMSAAAGFATLARVARPRPGNVIYWRNRAGRIFHAAILEKLEDTIVRTIGAHGGDSTTTTDDRARAQGACVKRKPFALASVAGFTVFPGQSYPGDLPSTYEPDPDPGDEPPEWWV